MDMAAAGGCTRAECAINMGKAVENTLAAMTRGMCAPNSGHAGLVWRAVLLERTNAHDHQKSCAEPAEVDHRIPSTLNKVIWVCAS